MPGSFAWPASSARQPPPENRQAPHDDVAGIFTFDEPAPLSLAMVEPSTLSVMRIVRPLPWMWDGLGRCIETRPERGGTPATARGDEEDAGSL